MKSNLKSILWMGITSAVFKRVRKVPVVKEKLSKSASCSKMSFLSTFKTLLGILSGRLDLLISREVRIILISSLLVGERKSKSGFLFVR